MCDTPSLQPQTPTRSVSAGRWSRATDRARAVSRLRRGMAPGDAAASPAQEPAATLTGVQSAQGDGVSRNDVRRGASPARSSTPPRLQAAVRNVRAAIEPPCAQRPRRAAVHRALGRGNRAGVLCKQYDGGIVVEAPSWAKQSTPCFLEKENTPCDDCDNVCNNDTRRRSGQRGRRRGHRQGRRLKRRW